MASYEEYAKRYSQEGNDEVIAEEIVAAEGQTQERIDATPDTTNWENRYKELEKLNSRQAQDLGNYRKMVDEYITVDPTPANEPTPVEAPHINVDDLYDNPEEAINKVVASHPDVLEAKKLRRDMEDRAKQEEYNSFTDKHSDFQDIAATPEFQNWVLDNPTRQALAVSADAMDLTAADALFSLYKAENGFRQVTTEAAQAQQIANASLEAPHGSEPPAPHQYSRSEMLAKKISAKQGDLEAEAYVNAHAVAYREALGSGNVRD